MLKQGQPIPRRGTVPTAPTKRHAPPWVHSLNIVISTQLRGHPFTHIPLPGQLPISRGKLFLGRIPTRSSVGGANIKEIQSASQQNIGLVISLVEKWEFITIGLEAIQPRTWQKANFQHCWLDVKDQTAAFDIAEFITAIRLMHRHLVFGKGVYVHCKSGMARSATLIAAYLLVRKLGLTLLPGQSINGSKYVQEAIRYLKRYRPIVYIKPCQEKFLVDNFDSWLGLAKNFTQLWKSSDTDISSKKSSMPGQDEPDWKALMRRN